MKNLYRFTQIFSKKYFVLFLIIYFVVGVVVSLNVGISHDEFLDIASRCADTNFQLCTHEMSHSLWLSVQSMFSTVAKDMSDNKRQMISYNLEFKQLLSNPFLNLFLIKVFTF